MKAGVVIGVGNSFRRDDGVGLAVVQKLAERGLPDVRTVTATGEPGALIDSWDGAAVAVVVDAAVGHGVAPGRILRWTPGDDETMGALSSHSVGIPQAFALGEALGRLPDRLVVLTVGIADAEHGLGLSPAVAAVVPAAVDAVLAELRAAPRTGHDDHG